MKNDIPMHVDSIDFQNQGGNDPISRVTGTYSDVAKTAMDRYNGYSNGTHRTESGVYIGDDYPQYKGRRYEFLVNVDSSNNSDITGDKVVCLPCPDFCVGSIDLITDNENIRKERKKDKKRYKLKDLHSYSLEKIGGYLRRRYFSKVYLSPVNDLHKIFLRLKKNKYVYIYELRLTLLLLSYTLHQYKYARRMKKYLDKYYSNYASYVELVGLYDDIQDKVEAKYSNTLAAKRKKITLVRLDNNHGGFLYPWQDIIKSIIEDSSVKNDYDEELSEIEETNVKTAYINQVYSVDKKDANELVDSISPESDMIIIIGHGNIDNTLHYYSDDTFMGKPCLIDNNNFIEALNNKFDHNKVVLLFFACNASKILEKSKFKNTIGTKGEYNIGMFLPFLMGFLSSYLVTDSNVDLSFQRGKKLETFLSHKGESIDRKK